MISYDMNANIHSWFAFLGHADAVNKCGLLHRDISSGNILILPMFEEKPGDFEFRVIWKGLLCDWELSKPIATRKTEEGRQPERMVRDLLSYVLRYWC